MQPTAFPAVFDIQNFFFDAAIATYAGNTPKTTITDLPRSKVYRFEQGDFLYIDTYFTNGEYSGGQTVIYFQSKPVWMMQYHGWCKDDDPKVLAFLKEALCAAYEERVFHGGRGDVGFPFGGQVRTITYGDYLIYRNDAGRILPCDFHKFSGKETIYRSHDKPKTIDGWKEVFWHRYQGMLLIPCNAIPDLPAIGDEIYVDDCLRYAGGKGKVIKTGSGFVGVEEHCEPGHTMPLQLHAWSELAPRQEELKQKFGDRRAEIKP